MNMSYSWTQHNNSVSGQSEISVSPRKGIPEGFWQLVHSIGTLDTPSLGHVVLFSVDSGGLHVFICFLMLLIKPLCYIKQALSVLQQCGREFCNMCSNDLALAPEVEVVFSLVTQVYLKLFSSVHINLISILCKINQTLQIYHCTSNI